MRQLVASGASFADVVLTRMFVTNEAIRRAHDKVFRESRPVTSSVEVKALIDARLLAEIKATAIISA